MNAKSLWKYVPSPGPVLSLALIGLLILSGLLYYRAIRIQRFLEPALAISQPRSEFSAAINQLVLKEFGEQPVSGMKVRTSSIIIKKSVLFTDTGMLTDQGRDILEKLSRVCRSLLQNDATRQYVSIVLINARIPLDKGSPASASERTRITRMVGVVRDQLLGSEPEIRGRYGSFFVAGTQPAASPEGITDVIEVRLIPSELLHIEVLQKLMKYAY